MRRQFAAGVEWVGLRGGLMAGSIRLSRDEPFPKQELTAMLLGERFDDTRLETHSDEAHLIGQWAFRHRRTITTWEGRPAEAPAEFVRRVEEEAAPSLAPVGSQLSLPPAGD
jgi:hypothetical protein